MSKLLIIRCNSYITRGIGRIEFCIDRWICVPRSVSVSFRLILLYVSSGCEEQSLQQKSVSKYQYWWSFVTLELSVPSLLPSESYGKQRVESLFHLSIRCFETTSPLFPPPPFSTMFRCFAFLVRAVYARKEFLFRFGLPYERTSTMESGGLTPRWLTIARNRGSRVISRSLSANQDETGRTRFERNSATIDGLTFPIRGRLGFWKTPARSPRAAWSRTWCTSRQDAPGRTGRAFCDSGRSECATGTCTMATWCEVSNNFLRQKRKYGKYWIESRHVPPKNFSRTNAWREKKKKSSSWRLVSFF